MLNQGPQKQQKGANLSKHTQVLFQFGHKFATGGGHRRTLKISVATFKRHKNVHLSRGVEVTPRPPQQRVALKDHGPRELERDMFLEMLMPSLTDDDTSAAN